MIYEISDHYQQYQQYQYFLEVNDIRELKHVKIMTKYQGAKFPDDIQSKVEFFLNQDEWKRLVEAVTSIK
jgi:hypothetical protein